MQSIWSKVARQFSQHAISGIYLVALLAVQVVEVVNMPNVAYANGRELPSAPPIAPFVIVQELRYILMGRTESGDIFCSSHIKILSIMQNNFPLRTLVHIHQNAL
jgi:hypothetical protein